MADIFVRFGLKIVGWDTNMLSRAFFLDPSGLDPSGQDHQSSEVWENHDQNWATMTIFALFFGMNKPWHGPRNHKKSTKTTHWERYGEMECTAMLRGGACNAEAATCIWCCCLNHLPKNAGHNFRLDSFKHPAVYFFHHTINRCRELFGSPSSSWGRFIFSNDGHRYAWSLPRYCIILNIWWSFISSFRSQSPPGCPG